MASINQTPPQGIKDSTLRGLPSYHHISMKNVWKNCYTTISLWPPNNSGAKISALFTGIRICKKYLHIFWGVASHRPVCLKKAKKIEVFHSSPFWNLNFGISKVNFLFNFWSFWDMIWKDVSFFSLDNQSIVHVWASFHTKFGHKDKSFILATKSRKGVSSPLSIFIMI